MGHVAVVVRSGNQLSFLTCRLLPLAHTCVAILRKGDGFLWRFGSVLLGEQAGVGVPQVVRQSVSFWLPTTHSPAPARLPLWDGILVADTIRRRSCPDTVSTIALLP